MSACAAYGSLTDRPGAPPRTTLSIQSRRVATPAGLAPARIVVRGERIEALQPYSEAPPSEGILDYGDHVILPGLVDTHVHVNEPGRVEWEGFETACAAAVSGGVTALIDMPLNSEPVTTTVEALERKRDAAGAACTIDFGFWAGLVPDSVDRVEALWEAGALGFKAFLVDSGLPAFAPVGRGELARAMPRLAALGAPLLAHAEAPGPIAGATARALAALAADPALAGRHATWEASRPPTAEADAIDLLAELALDTGCRVHIVHVASRDAVARVRAAKRAGASLTAETCPHYLTLDVDRIADGAVEYKCAPPLRGAAHREALWEGLADGALDLVATDHSPCPPDLKGPEAGFFGAWGGISSLGLALPVVWTAARARGVPLSDLARWLSGAPASLAGLSHSKGEIRPGADADLAIFDPDAEVEVTRARLRFRHPITPYLGAVVRGRVVATFARGRLVFGEDHVEARPQGRWLAGPGRVAPAATPPRDTRV